MVTHDPEFILRQPQLCPSLRNGQIQESSIEDSDGRKRLLKFFLSDMKKECVHRMKGGKERVAHRRLMMGQPYHGKFIGSVNLRY